MIWLLIGAFSGMALNIPKPKSMKNLENITSEESILNTIWGFILHNRWLISGVFFTILTLIILYLVFYSLIWKKSEKSGSDDDVIFFEGRKLFLPQSDVLKSTEKYYLSEDFSEVSLKNDASEIYHETLISRIGVPRI